MLFGPTQGRFLKQERERPAGREVTQVAVRTARLPSFEEHEECRINSPPSDSRARLTSA
jgi:hypothetical protein